MIHFRPGRLLTLLLPVLAGCQAAVNLTPYRELTFPPSTEVEVLQGEPSQPYEALGEMWVDARDPEGVLKMRQKAMEIGADAIILLGDRSAGVVAVPLPGGGGVVAREVSLRYAVAIRYER